MNVAELRSQLIEWLSDVKSWGKETEQNWDEYIFTPKQIHQYHMGDEISQEKSVEDPDKLYVLLWTNDHQYQISARLPKEDGERTDNKGYLSLTAKVRKPRAGENWQRGNDLHDGDFSIETFNKILKDIVKYELIAKVKAVKPIAVYCDCNNPQLSEDF